MKKLMRAASAVLAATMALSVTAFAEEGGTFKIGGIGPLTGSTAIYGQAVMNAAQMAADEINAAGGINGYQIEFNPQDDESDAEKKILRHTNLSFSLGCQRATEFGFVISLFQGTHHAVHVMFVIADDLYGAAVIQAHHTEDALGIGDAALHVMHANLVVAFGSGRHDPLNFGEVGNLDLSYHKKDLHTYPRAPALSGAGKAGGVGYPPAFALQR